MEANCKRVIETIAPQQELHDVIDVIEPTGPLSLLKWLYDAKLKNK